MPGSLTSCALCGPERQNLYFCHRFVSLICFFDCAVLPLTSISTHTLRKEGDGTVSSFIASAGISTHTLRKEGDSVQVSARPHGGISTHTLRKEGDFRGQMTRSHAKAFQPTPSARRVTRERPHGPSIIPFQPTPSARRVTMSEGLPFPSRVISTHTLRKEGDVSDTSYKLHMY